MTIQGSRTNWHVAQEAMSVPDDAVVHLSAFQEWLLGEHADAVALTGEFEPWRWTEVEVFDHLCDSLTTSSATVVVEVD